MEKLEKIIRDNIHEFDDQPVNRQRIWSQIESNLPQRKKHRTVEIRRRYLNIAASFVVLSLALGFIYLNVKSNSMQSILANQNELHDINSYYNQLIDYKIEKIKLSSALSENDRIEFMNYFQELEEESKILEKDLMNNIDNAEVLSAIVENYRKRLQVLENVLRRINQPKKSEDEKSISI